MAGRVVYPDKQHWRWTQTQEQLEFVILGGTQERLRILGTIQDLCFPVWRALRALQSYPCWDQSPEKANYAWSNPFPHKETKQLGEKLRALKP